MSKINPFSNLYLGETLGNDNNFVCLFSDKVVSHADPLYSDSNVILKGYQGMGKSMLLSLLSPQIRVAFCHSRRPIPEAINRFFLTAEINLTTTNILSIGQRPVFPEHNSDHPQNQAYACSLFEDFFNYRTLISLLLNLRFMSQPQNRDCFGEHFHPEKLDFFARNLAREDCFHGFLSCVTSMEELISTVDSRIKEHKRFIAYNCETLPETLQTTKTSIGLPLEAAQQHLRQSGCVTIDAPLYINIDQYEILNSAHQDPNHFFQEIIHKALSSRRAGVFYKIGTRLYGWSKTPRIFGTNLVLEMDRDYKEVDLSIVMHRSENPSTHIFPSFATDVFERRMKYLGKIGDGKIPSPKEIFGSGYSIEKQEELYGAKNTTSSRAFPYPLDYPDIWKKFIKEVGKIHGILEAKLAFAWSLQKRPGSRNECNYHTISDPLTIDNPKKTAWGKIYWRKERIPQAWLQLAAGNAQRLVWAGEQDIMQLSSTNILIFLRICQFIWEQRDRAESRRGYNYNMTEPIDPTIQSVAIYNASQVWFDKIYERPDGSLKKTFIEECGRFLREQLRQDFSMSYPGAVGFSLQKIATDFPLPNGLTIRHFLEKCADDELLMIVKHTSKEAKKTKQEKIYLHPIFSPYLQLHSKHIKEPYYATTQEFLKWMGINVDPITFENKKKQKSTNSHSEKDTLFNWAEQRNKENPS